MFYSSFTALRNSIRRTKVKQQLDRIFHGCVCSDRDPSSHGWLREVRTASWQKTSGKAGSFVLCRTA